MAKANEQTAKIRRFHNWIYACNPHVAETYKTANGGYRRLENPVTYGSVSFSYDTPEYRKQKFLAEYRRYLCKESALFYFVFFEFFLGVDSFEKNMTVCFITKDIDGAETPVAHFMPRDSDTGMMYGNTGLLKFAVHNEWNDMQGTTPVYNGYRSGLWDIVSSVWSNDIADMYTKMKSNGLSADGFWKKACEFWSQWCEGLYCTDAMGYVNTGRLDMAHGDKREIVRYFLGYRERYMDSKYRANTGTPMEMRLWGTSSGIALRYARPLYSSIKFGAGNILTHRNLSAGSPSRFDCGSLSFSETTVTTYNSDLLTEITAYNLDGNGLPVETGLQGTFTDVEITNVSHCRRLKKFNIDFSGRNASQKLDGRVLKVGDSIALEELTIRNAPNVAGEASFVSQTLRKVDLRDTGVTGLSIPSSTALESVRLGSKVNDLHLAGFANLSELTLQGYADLKSISITGCPMLNKPESTGVKCATRQLVEATLATEGNVLRSLTIDRVEWVDVTTDTLMRLADIRPDIRGIITLKDGESISFQQKVELIKAFGDIDSADAKLRVVYEKVHLASIEMSSDAYYGAAGNYGMVVAPSSSKANDFTALAWSISSEANATIDAKTGVLTVTSIGTEAEKQTAVVTCRATLSDGTEVSTSMTIGFYDRQCRVGDIVYHDGTFSDRLNKLKTPIGVCFYINPEDKTDRLMVSLHDVANDCWGISYYTFGGMTLADTPGYDVCDLPLLDNKPSHGISGSSINASNYRDAVNGDADGFKIFAKSTAAGELGAQILTFDLMGHKAGEKLPWGMISTLRIIEHRNRILSDSSVNLPIPTATGTQTVFQNLSALIGQVVSANGADKYRQYYYPAASFCNSWEPPMTLGNTLSDRFKAGNWFLPTFGELARVRWYRTQGYDASNPDAAFARAKNYGVLAEFSDSNHRTSTESSRIDIQGIYVGGSGYIANAGGGYSKDTKGAIRAVCAF